MGHRHRKEDLLAGALDLALESGLSELSFGRVARRLGIHDRTVVYYFPSKNDLVTEVVLAMGLRLQTALDQAFTGIGAVHDHIELARVAWPVVTDPEHQRVFALFFEANGLAAAGRDPYQSLVPQLIAAWIGWLTEIFDGPAEQRRAEATATVALIDGLLLLRGVAGATESDRAAAALGIA